MHALIISSAVLLLAGTWAAVVRRGLKKLDGRCFGTIAKIDAEQSRRWNALFEVSRLVEAYDSEDYEALCGIIQKRGVTGVAVDAEAVSQQDNILSEAFSKVLAVCEKYPELKMQPAYAESIQLLDTYEDSVSVSRAAYNDTVTLFNRRVRALPVSFVAGAMGFKVKDYLDTPGERTQMPSKCASR